MEELIYFDFKRIVTQDVHQAVTFVKRTVDQKRKDKYGYPVVISEEWGVVRREDQYMTPVKI
jgi:hypothetical protein